MNAYIFNPSPLPKFSEFLVSENTLISNEIKAINDFWDSSKSIKAELEGGEDLIDESLRKSSVMSIVPGGSGNWIFERLTKTIYDANSFYNFDLNGFFEPLQLAEYQAGDFFDWHLDFGAGPSSTRKLSLSIQLSDSDDYEGGDLEFRIDNRIIKAPRTPGTAIIFPSFVMHRVSEITKGTRRSLVGWVSGPSFR